MTQQLKIVHSLATSYDIAEDNFQVLRNIIAPAALMYHECTIKAAKFLN